MPIFQRLAIAGRFAFGVFPGLQLVIDSAVSLFQTFCSIHDFAAIGDDCVEAVPFEVEIDLGLFPHCMRTDLLGIFYRWHGGNVTRSPSSRQDYGSRITYWSSENCQATIFFNVS